MRAEAHIALNGTPIDLFTPLQSPSSFCGYTSDKYVHALFKCSGMNFLCDSGSGYCIIILRKDWSIRNVTDVGHFVSRTCWALTVIAMQ